jgi:hypothetical protein
LVLSRERGPRDAALIALEDLKISWGKPSRLLAADRHLARNVIAFERRSVRKKFSLWFLSDSE